MTLLMEKLKLAKGIDPVADVFDTTQRSDVVSIRDHGRVLFVIHIGVGATGSSTFTVNACDDVVPTTRSTIGFWSRETLTGDTPGAITRRAAAGFVNTIGSSKIIEIEVDAKDAAALGYGFVELNSAESVNSPVLGGVLIILGGWPNRYQRSVNATVIV